MSTTRLPRRYRLIVASAVVCTLAATLLPTAASSASTTADETMLAPAFTLERGLDGGVNAPPSDEAASEPPGPEEPTEEPAATAAHLGLHVTAEELEYWQSRWSGGAEDTFLDARIGEEKDRITRHQREFMANPSAQLWSPRVVLGSDGYADDISNRHEIRMQSARTRDAAFWALVSDAPTQERADVLRAVGDVLRRQPDQPGVSNIHSDQPWGTGGHALQSGQRPHFAVTHAYVTELFAYDYFLIGVEQGLVDDLSTSDHDAIRTMHDRWGSIASWTVEDRINKPFVDRPGGDYTLTPRYADADNVWSVSGGPNTYLGGPLVHRGIEHWNNRIMSLARYSMLTALLLDDEDRREKTRLALRDFLRYAVSPDGTFGDMHRGWSQQHTGLRYMSHQYAHAMVAVDALARAGDTSLYTESTTEGMHDTVGAPHLGPDTGKTYLFAGRTLARYGNHTWDRRNGNNQRFDWHDNARTPPLGGNHDRLIVGNLYWQEDIIRDFYRGENGMPTWELNANGTTDLNASWSFAAPYLMWAGLEGQVWPYPTK